ncbi:IMP dehydrogenase [Burkholderia pseudomallei]|uniref:IMP dehydrogenase n=1 Tax=Burkholderia pseudomallei TaxID=28450 RepID=UPI000F0609DF|nr:IMP dehydrogenase [Burkholderia pseudomallei]MDY7777241.1 IMP dehydrogenase [Burkholderia pseudomallei]MDY7809422.1 IMP dehydrogenase [Burkholderia pseudomallei]
MRDVQRPAKSSGMRMAFCEIDDARASPLRFDGGLSEYSALFRKVVKFHDMTC